MQLKFSGASEAEDIYDLNHAGEPVPGVAERLVSCSPERGDTAGSPAHLKG